MLLAVIFCVGSGPDSPIGIRMKYSRNNSVAFSRISAIWGDGNCLVEEVSDGEMEWISASFYRPGSLRTNKKWVHGIKSN
jgi:hypothetical protein